MNNEEAIKWLKAIDEKYIHGGDECFDEQRHEAIKIAIKALEARPTREWIPVSERLPEEREWYLAVFKESDTGFQLIPRVADYIGDGKNEWRLIDEDGLVKEYRDILECIAWMPLPKPYKEGD